MTRTGRVYEGQVGAGTNGVTDPALADLATSEADEAWLARTRVFLSPIAPPSVMGLFGFAIATLMVGAWQAGWYGSATTPELLWPFTLVAGGVLQLVAAVACYRARDSIALAVHSVWGAFWTAWSVMMLLVTLHDLPSLSFASANANFAFWFIGLSIVTLSATLAALAKGGMLTLMLGCLTAGSILTAIGFYSGSLATNRAGGWLYVVSAAAAWLFATAMMMENSFGRTIIPLGKFKADSNIPGRSGSSPEFHHQRLRVPA
jgi:succinate-acetate transporter protein